MDHTSALAIPYAAVGDNADAPALTGAMSARMEALLLPHAAIMATEGNPKDLIIVQSDGTTAYKAMGGDATIDASGAVAIGTKKVKTGMIDDLAVTGAKIDNATVGRTKLTAATLQTQRSTLGAAIVPQSSTDVAMIWPTPFADTNYCVSFSLVWSAGSGIVAAHITAIDRFAATFTIKNIEAGGSGRNWSGGIHATAVHD